MGRVGQDHLFPEAEGLENVADAAELALGAREEEQGHEKSERVEEREEDRKDNKSRHLAEEEQHREIKEHARTRRGDRAGEDGRAHLLDCETEARLAVLGADLVARVVVHVAHVNRVVDSEADHDDARDGFGDAEVPIEVGFAGTEHGRNDEANRDDGVEGDHDVAGGEDESGESHRESDGHAEHEADDEAFFSLIPASGVAIGGKAITPG
mmetsp:Transcript_47969/g.133824  ORF Transcript_47969/g.133824 Transcript_47969/m.133824 type:complete len:211 (-) Transcript_47969:2584-3216(-)